MLEIFVSFSVLFGVFTLAVNYFNNYRKERGFEYQNVWAVNFGIPPGISNKDTVNMMISSLRNMISAIPDVENISFSSGNIPYSANTYNSMVNYEKKELMTHIYVADRNYLDVLGLKMESGNWEGSLRNSTRTKGVVLNTTLKEALFGNANPVGKTLKLGDEQLEVRGVVKDFKNFGDYQAVENGIIKVLDTVDASQQWMILLKVKQGANAASEARLYKTVSNFSKNANVEIEHLSKKRTSKNKLTLIPMLILFIVSAFLIVNVALGIFGVLWYNINKRRAEIGLRRAIGASTTAIAWQISGEAMVLSTISLLAGTFFAVQFPLLNVFDLPSNVYFAAIFLSVMFIYSLVLICSLYPAKQASAIYPAVALHEE